MGYWSSSVQAGAVVMRTDAEIDEWPQVYRERCFDSAWMEKEAAKPPRSPVRAVLRWTSTSADDSVVEVDHVLLRIPRSV